VSDWTSAYHGLDDAALGELSSPGLVRRAAKVLVNTEIDWDDRGEKAGKVRVGDTVVQLDERGPASARCPCATAGVCLHVVLATMFVRSVAEPPEPDVIPPSPDVNPPSPDVILPSPDVILPEAGSPPTEDGVTAERAAPQEGGDGILTDVRMTSIGEEQSDLITEVRQELADILSAGLSHVSALSADRVTGLVTSARTTGLPLLSRYLGTLAGTLTALAERRDDTGEAGVLSNMAEVWALTRALDAASAANDPDTLQRLTGQVRRQFDARTDQLTLIPLGAHWWVTPSGARGMTLVAWDIAEQQMRTVTSARPAGVDAGFTCSPDNSAFFHVAIRRLLESPFTLVGPRIADDGSLSPTAQRWTPDGTGFDPGTIAAIAQYEWDEGWGAPSAGFGRPDNQYVVLAPAHRDEPYVDEPRQEIVWPLADKAGNTLELRQSVLDNTTRIDTLLALADQDVVYVTAHRAAGGAWEPVSAFVLTKEQRQAGKEQGDQPASEKLKLLTLDFSDIPIKKKGLVARWWQAWRRRVDAARMRPATPRTLVGRLCDDVRLLNLQVAATGRRTFGADQRRRCQALAGRANDVALSTLADTLTKLAGQVSADNILRAQLIADRLDQLDAD